MECKFLPCNCCNRLLKSTKVAITGTSPNQVLTVTIPETNLQNLENYCFIICQSLPSGSNALRVVISNGTQIIPLECRLGNYVHADQLVTRHRYPLVYGNDPVHCIITNSLCRTCFTIEE